MINITVYVMSSPYDMEEISKEDLDWSDWNLFVVPSGTEPYAGDKVLMVSYNGEGWFTLNNTFDWMEWPGELSPGFYRNLIKAPFKNM